MEKELNIAAILRDKPIGTKLWSPMFGEGALDYISKNDMGFNVSHHKSELQHFLSNGKLCEDGALCVFPSRNMRDWSKFAWKKGDVLTYANGSSKMYCVFKKWKNEDYTEFYCDWFVKDNFQEPNRYTWCDTSNFHLASKCDTKEYSTILKNLYGSTYNLSTLEIEKPEFKDGDIVVSPSTANTDRSIFIFKKLENNRAFYYAGLIFRSSDLLQLHINDTFRDFMEAGEIMEISRFATDEERKQLFDALAKEGKVWNCETKQIEDLPKKCEFKAFDKVLVRCKDYQKWKVDFFSHYDDSCKGFPYVCVSSRKSFCIPYNNQTAHLLGTTEEWKGGEHE